MSSSRTVSVEIGRGDGGLANASYPTYQDIRTRTTMLNGVYAHQMFPRAMSLATGDAAAAERVFAHFVTTNYFAVLGAAPAANRLMGAMDGEQPGASPVAVLSDGFWTRRFNRDPAVGGRAVRLDQQPFTVAGVAPKDFQGTGVLATDLWLPLNMVATGKTWESIVTNRHGAAFAIGARLGTGVSVAQASAEIDALGRVLDREHPNPAGPQRLRALPSSRAGGNSRVIALFLAMLMTIVSLVLMVACANVASILLSRAAARRREIAVRLAIGAGRSRLVRQLLTETTLLIVLGGIGGLLLARLATSVIVPLLPSLPFPVSVTLALDERVLAFTIALSLVAALLSGLLPALQSSKADVARALKDESPSPRGSRLRSAFVVGQVALSILLAVMAGMFVRALQRAGSSDPGFDPRGVELATVNISTAGYTDKTGPRFQRELVDRVRQLPSVESATLARVLPGGFEGIGLGAIAAPGYVNPNGKPFFFPSWNVVDPGYFATLKIPIVEGRDFADLDVAGRPPVAIVGERIARLLWPGQRAVGQLISHQGFGPQGPEAQPPRLIVGVVRDVNTSSLIDGLAESYVYVPLRQQYQSTVTLAVRAKNGQRLADAIRGLVATMDPNLPIVTSETLEDWTALGLVPRKIAASAAGSLGFVGMVLAAIGIYGVTAYAVERRTREFGIRIALGAPNGEILKMVIGQGIRLALAGTAIGLVLAAGASTVLVGFLFGIPPLDPVVFGGTAALFVAVGLAACHGPARRATKVDPLVVLRYE